MGWIEAESNVRPKDLDKISSKEYVYIRKNIEEVSKTEDDGSTVTMYKYLEKKIPKKDWDYYQQLESNADALESLMTDVIPSLITQEV